MGSIGRATLNVANEERPTSIDLMAISAMRTSD